MPKRKTKNARYMNFYLDSTVAERIDAYSAATGIPKSRVVEDAVIAYLEKAEEVMLRLKEIRGN